MKKEVKNVDPSTAAGFLAERKVKLLDEISSKYSPLKPEDMAALWHMERSQMVKCVAGIDTNGTLHVMMVPEGASVRLDVVSEMAGDRVRALKPEELSQFGAVKGAVSPLQFRNVESARFYMESKLLRESKVGMNADDANSGILISPRDLSKALGAETCSIAKGLRRK